MPERALARSGSPNVAPPTPHLLQLAVPSWPGAKILGRPAGSVSTARQCQHSTALTTLIYKTTTSICSLSASVSLTVFRRRSAEHSITLSAVIQRAQIPLSGLHHTHTNARGQARVRAPEATMSAASRVKALTLPQPSSLLARTVGGCCYYSPAAAARALPGRAARCGTFSKGVGATGRSAWRVEGVRWSSTGSSSSSSSSSVGSDDGDSIASSQTSLGSETSVSGEAQPTFAFAFE